MQRACASAVIILLTANVLAVGKPRITLEVITRPHVPVTASQQWYKTLTDLGLDGVRIRSGTAQDQPSVTGDQDASRAVRVVGVLTEDNILHLPGAKFGARDTARLRKWLQELGDQGIEGVTEPKSAFGLSARQLEQAMSDLRRPVTFKTRGMLTTKALRQAAESLQNPIAALPTVERALAATTCAGELQGMSSGTALAALLRPAGLALAPRSASGGKLEYQVARSQAGRESWPVGWKPKDKPNKVLPELFEFLNVEIADIPVSEALAAIEGRLKVPFLFDHNSLAARGVDPTKVQAEVPSKRMTYSQILHKLLTEAKLKYELRVDEADQPFVWITTIKPID